MSEVAQNEDSKIAEKKKKEFEGKYQNQIERINNISNHELFNYENMKNGDLIKNEKILSMRAGIETILNYVTREFSTIESDWVLNIFKERFNSIESDFNIFASALKENLKNSDIIKISGEKFDEYFNNMIQRVDHLRYSLEYLVRLNSSLKIDANKVLLLSNNELVKGLEDTKESLVKEVEEFRRNRAISENAKTEDIYNNAVNKYKGLEDKYRKYFYNSIGATVTLSLLLLFFKQKLIPNILGDIEFWVLKGSIFVIGITLITYFLKQSSHYQHLADQNYQTQVELQAYPTFMESIPTEEAASVRKELALKYFGREIDGAAHKDMSNLIADQMKSTTEMVKASTEAIKNLKG